MFGTSTARPAPLDATQANQPAIVASEAVIAVTSSRHEVTAGCTPRRIAAQTVRQCVPSVRWSRPELRCDDCSARHQSQPEGYRSISNIDALAAAGVCRAAGSHEFRRYRRARSGSRPWSPSVPHRCSHDADARRAIEFPLETRRATHRHGGSLLRRRGPTSLASRCRGRSGSCPALGTVGVSSTSRDSRPCR